MPRSLILSVCVVIFYSGGVLCPGVSLRNRSSKLGKFPIIALLALAACGGTVEPSRVTIREESTPAVATLAAPATAGAALLFAGDLSGARAAFEAELASRPGQLGPLNDLAVGYFLDGHVDAARRLLDEVVASGTPRQQQGALLNLGALYAVEGHATAAQAYLEAARALDPARPEPHYALALLADARGEPALARATLREALRLDDGTARAAFAFPFREGRRHLDGLLAEQAGEAATAAAAWRDLAAARFPTVAGAAQRHLLEP
jgi:Tfp pilus assembly protein PilF